MAPTNVLMARSNEVVLSSTTVDLLIVLLALLLTALAATCVTFMFRRYRRCRAAGLPLHRGCKSPCNYSAHTKSLFVYNEKQELLSSTSSPPSTALPEIRITFPEEVDEKGVAQSGNVVVVQLGENGEVGLGPVQESLPAYQKDASDRFQSLDLDRIGGLKEKDTTR